MKLWVITVSWMRSAAILTCNTERRFTDNCQASNWDKSSLELYRFYSLTVANYPLLQNNTACVKEVYFPSYYALEASVIGTDDSDSAMWLGSLLVISVYLV
jgi:hypothetical protein